MADDWQQTRRDLERVDRLIHQCGGRIKEIYRTLKRYGITDLKSGVRVRKEFRAAERAAAVRWTKLMKEVEPELAKVKELAEGLA